MDDYDYQPRYRKKKSAPQFTTIAVGLVVVTLIVIVAIAIFKPSWFNLSKSTKTTTTTTAPKKQTTTSTKTPSFPYSAITTTTAPTNGTSSDITSGTTTTTVAGTFSATGSYATYVVDPYHVVVFTGNGTISFSKNTSVSIIAVAGGGGGGGGQTGIGWVGQPYNSNQYTIYYNANGGDGGANIFCQMTSTANTAYTIDVGNGGISGSIGSSGGAGGDTTFSSGTTELITCKGGAGGAYNGSNANISSYYTVDTTTIQNVQSGNYISNNSLQGGAGGKEASGSNSATYTVPFTGIPDSLRLDSNVNSYVKTYYSGGGGGSISGKGGDAGNGVGGGITTNTTGTAANLYGAGGGAGGNGVGGTGASGIMIFYFILES